MRNVGDRGGPRRAAETAETARGRGGRRGPRGVLLLAALLLLPALVAAEEGGTIGVSPAEVRVGDAQKGQVYLRNVHLQNRFATDSNITLELLGEVGGWTRANPQSGFAIPAKSNATIALRIAVPSDASNGTHVGQLRISAEAKGSPNGSGLSFRHAVLVKLNVTIAGAVVVRAHVAQATTEDVEAGSNPVASARVVNGGNVATTVRVRAEILSADGTQVLAVFEADVSLLPGESAQVPLAFSSSLPVGTYRLRVTTTSGGVTAEEVGDFKVVPPGTLGKSGAIRALDHEAWGEVGVPVRIAARFANTGNATIARAELRGEVKRDGKLTDAFASPPLLVPAGSAVDLVAYFSPKSGGAHAIRAWVVYDGFETPVEGSLVTIEGPPGLTLPPNAWAIAAVLGGALLLFVVWRRRKREEP